MSDQFKLREASDDSKVQEVCGLVSEGFIPHMTGEQTGKLVLELIKRDKENKYQVFYLEQKSTGKPVCMAQVVHQPGFFKDADKSAGISSTPDPELFGVKHITVLKIGFVVTAEPYRKLGLANKLVSETMKRVEDQLIAETLKKTEGSKKDNFAEMVKDSNGVVDSKLAVYYMSKRFFWVLYSGAGKFYERFGFKSFPIEFYKIPTSIVDQQQDTLDSLLGISDKDPMAVGKRLRLLDSAKPQDRDLVSFMLQGKELEILTELNKSIFHSELSGGRKSSSSLTNMTELLSMTKITSNSDLKSVSENPATAQGRRKSSIHHQAVSKLALKPNVNSMDLSTFFSNGVCDHLEGLTEENKKFNKIEGAIFTNDLQQKSHYILWSTVADQFVIIGVGELQFNMFGAMADPLGKGGQKSRRGSSFTGLNELGGYNFQDLDILFSVACMVCKKRSVKDTSSVYVAVHDLPNSIPAPMLNDYFLNYLPKAFDSVEASDSDSASKRVEFITDASDRLRILPMVRRFGQNSATFELDWVANGMWSWG